MKALNNDILLDLPVQLGTFVRVYTPSCCPYICLAKSHASAQWHLPSSASRCLWGLCFVTSQGCTNCVEGRNCSWVKVAPLHHATGGDCGVSIELSWRRIGRIAFYTSRYRTGQTLFYAEAKRVSSPPPPRKHRARSHSGLSRRPAYLGRTRNIHHHNHDVPLTMMAPCHEPNSHYASDATSLSPLGGVYSYRSISDWTTVAFQVASMAMMNDKRRAPCT